ncbi:MAG: LysR family transcriptional regulator [Betaproteobacteria bacterium]|nr:LysR family transcriptional regulator [Betaproteobacteria bacterium]
MRFKGLDLNLLVALDMLLDERNVTRAAQRMNVGQPAMSAALARLRDHFGDDLLAVTGRRLMPTALAETLRQPLREAILQIEAVVGMERNFVPATSQRHFAIEMPDYLVPVLLPVLTRRLSHAAPGIVLELRSPSRDPSALLHKGELDLLITPGIYSDPDYPSEVLASTHLVLVGWADNPDLQQQPSLATVRRLQQAIVPFDRIRLARLLTEDQLELYGGKGRVGLIVPNFSCIPPSLVGTNLISLLDARLAATLIQNLPLVVWDVPIAMPTMDDVMMFHPLRDHDGGLQWLRSELHAATATLG